MLPNRQHGPACPTQLPRLAPIPPAIRLDLCYPPLPIVLRHGEMQRTPMPEATVDEYDNLCFRKYKIRLPWQPGHIGSVTNLPTSQFICDPLLGRCPSSPHQGHSVGDRPRLGRRALRSFLHDPRDQTSLERDTEFLRDCTTPSLVFPRVRRDRQPAPHHSRDRLDSGGVGIETKTAKTHAVFTG